MAKSEAEKKAQNLKYATDPEYRAYKKDCARRWREENPTRVVELKRQHHTGFTPADTERFRAEQRGVCAICPVVMDTENRKGMRGEHADHCHETGRPRGLLCRACNQALGFYEKYQRPAGLVIQPYERYLTK